MKVTLLMVSSLNGYITQGDDPHIHAWTSPEDQTLFAKAIEHSSLIVMGRATYEAAKEAAMHLQEGKRRIVMTHTPLRYKQYVIPGQLEFTDENPQELVARLAQEGYKDMLLVGGAALNAAFFEAGLVDEVHLTIEPVLLGSGKPLVSPTQAKIGLTLIDMKKLNDRGTLHCVYSVNKKA